MAYNGSGTFVRLYNWVQDAANSINIVPTRHDSEDDGFATGLSNCLTKDGQQVATANQPMGGFAHTGVGNGTVRTQYSSIAQVQDGGLTYLASTGSANAYVLTLAPAIAAYVAGQKFTFKANFLSTGACTLNVNGVGAISIKVEGLFDPTPYAFKTGQIIEVEYDGTNFQPLNMKATTGDLLWWASSTPKPDYLWCDGITTIGSASSGATVAAAYAEGLFRHLWDSVVDGKAPVSTGRGVSAAADFAANKKLTLPTSKDLSPYGIGSTISGAFGTSGASTVAATGTVAVTMNATTLTAGNIPTINSTVGLFGSAGAAGTTNIAGVTGTSTGANGSATNVVSSNTSGSSFTPSVASSTFTGSVTSVVHPIVGLYLTIKI